MFYLIKEADWRMKMGHAAHIMKLVEKLKEEDQVIQKKSFIRTSIEWTQSM
ncbi:18791_t:CDS:2 [Rhizophagus irregularis]|nr:18791_t:CDS:2 [Rhizophagus irregularis]